MTEMPAGEAMRHSMKIQATLFALHLITV
jgi:hypothetical protein